MQTIVNSRGWILWRDCPELRWISAHSLALLSLPITFPRVFLYISLTSLTTPNQPYVYVTWKNCHCGSKFLKKLNQPADQFADKGGAKRLSVSIHILYIFLQKKIRRRRHNPTEKKRPSAVFLIFRETRVLLCFCFCDCYILVTSIVVDFSLATVQKLIRRRTVNVGLAFILLFWFYIRHYFSLFNPVSPEKEDDLFLKLVFICLKVQLLIKGSSESSTVD